MHTAPPPLTPRKKRRGSWRWVAASSLVIVGAATWWAVHDEPPHNLSDFDTPVRFVADENNTYLILRDAALALPVLPELDDHAETPELGSIINGEVRLVPDTVDALLAAYPDLEPTLAKAAAATDSQPPRLDDFTATIPESKNLRILLQLGLIRALRTADQGDDALAFAQAEQVLHLARHIEASRGTILQLLIGQSLVVDSFTSVRRIADQTDDPALLLSLATRLETRRGDVDSVASALKNEARVVSRLLGSRQALHALSAELTDKQTWFSRTIFSLGLLLHKPNETQRVYATYIREGIASLDQPWRKTRDTPAILNLQNYLDQPLLTRIPNLQGRSLINIFAPSIHAFHQNHLRGEAWLDLTRVHLALRAYHLNKGQLPPDLASLVPDYLPAIPADPFTTAPLAYSIEDYAIWSVGPYPPPNPSADFAPHNALISKLVFALPIQAQPD